MTEFRSKLTLPPVPDDLTIPQFILDANSHKRPPRPDGVPWLIDDDTGRSMGYEQVIYLQSSGIFVVSFLFQVKDRTLALANGLRSKWSIGGLVFFSI